MMRHRSDIDGLRAFAIVPVLLSHAGFAWCPGGYLGVDVFFVISGFLITGIVLGELAAGTFSAIDFYERRARRILAPLVVLMFATLLGGWFLMSADAYQNLGQSVVATTVFANNMLLTLTSGYWELESGFKPLLHTWSLGVEEQYYLVVPVLLWLAHRYMRDRIIQLILLIGGLSLATCLWSATMLPVANFYLLPTRAWELAVGGAAAAWLGQRGGARPTSVAIPILGMAMIVLPMLIYPEALPSPSLSTAVPVLGTMLVLVWGGEGPVDRVLSWSPIVFLGLISYSTYLWHQPLFAFLRIVSLTRPEPWQFGLMIAPTLAIATASWRFVEAPFRNRERVSRRTLLVTMTGSCALLLAAGLGIHFSGGLPNRLPVAPGSPPPGSYVAYNMSAYAFKRDAFGPQSARRLLVVGNSTARDFINTAREAGRFTDYELIYRDDIMLCRPDPESPVARDLIRASTLIVAVGYGAGCNFMERARMPDVRDKLIVVGPRDFGDNLNPFARMPLDARTGAHTLLSRESLALNAHNRRTVPPEIYLDFIRHLSPDGHSVPVFDESGRLLSEDRAHVTRSGARYVGKLIFDDPVWAHVQQTAAARAASEKR